MHFGHMLKLKLLIKLYLSELKEWEFDFVVNLHTNHTSPLTDKQESKLNEIWDKARKVDRIFQYETAPTIA